MILVHHLRIGRSVFTVWLLEELGLDYELKIYERLETGRAPETLKNAHPLGKSPGIEIDLGGERITLAESGAIANTLIDQFDTGHKLSPPRSDAAARAKWTQWLHYPEGSAMLPLMLQLLIARGGVEAPAPYKIFADAETALHFGYLEGILSGQDYVCGETFQAPDIGVTFLTYMGTQLGLLGDYPALQAYHAKTMDRAAFKRAMEKTGG